ncbi:hypothetical protein [Arcanobacterium phocae]|uniref:hypothetical protein n=1 Tax=Arcanobacterium phocae TaxID=131112 RepID=UPI001C0F3446|nr:hypothetical protein [Arcanobacterium phocae]
MSEQDVQNTESENTESVEKVETDWKAEARKWESRAKSNHEAVEKLAELEQTHKALEAEHSEALSKLQTELDGYRKREERQTWIAEIVQDSEIPGDLLRGDTKEELQAHFEQLEKALMDKSSRHGTAFPGSEKQPEKAPKNDWLAQLFGSH